LHTKIVLGQKKEPITEKDVEEHGNGAKAQWEE
jgi:hypothetical protein